MGSKIILVLFLTFTVFSCNEISCRFNKVPDPPYPNPDKVEDFKTNIVNQVTYVYNCLDNDIYSKQFVAITYTVERSFDPNNSSSSNIDCWQESVHINIGIC